MSKANSRGTDTGGGTFSLIVDSTHENYDLREALERSVQVARFVIKLLTEMSFLRADRATLQAEGNLVKIGLQSRDEQIKSAELERTWFNPIVSWLCERCSVFGTGLVKQPAPLESSLDFVCAVRIEDELYTFRVKKNTHLTGVEVLTLSAPTEVPLATAFAQLEIVSRAGEAFAHLVSGSKGFLAVASPDKNNLTRSIAAILSLSSGHFIKVTEAEDPALIEEFAQRHLLITGVLAGEALEAASRLREEGWNLSSPSFAGVFCQGYARRVCDNCARVALPDVDLVEMLPESLQNLATSGYCVGRGCERCNHTGYVGALPVQSLLIADQKTRELFAAGADQAALIDYLYARGTRPLIEDGLRKMSQGKLTLEALFELTKVVPAPYHKYYGGAGSGATVARTKEMNEALKARAQRAAWSVTSVPLPADKKSRETVTATSGPQEQKGTGPLILVVEDNADQRTILEMVFKSAKYEVLCAVDGLDALQKLQKGLRPDLVVLDMMMPRMNGREFIAKVKEENLLSGTPVLVLTVVSDAEKEYDMLDLGVDDYCEKTIQRKILLKRVEKLLKRRKE